jgi:hypothetical protein
MVLEIAWLPWRTFWWLVRPETREPLVKKRDREDTPQRTAKKLAVTLLGGPERVVITGASPTATTRHFAVPPRPATFTPHSSADAEADAGHCTATTVVGAAAPATRAYITWLRVLPPLDVAHHTQSNSNSGPVHGKSLKFPFSMRPWHMLHDMYFCVSASLAASAAAAALSSLAASAFLFAFR